MPRGGIAPHQGLGCIDEIRRIEGHRDCTRSPCGKFKETSRQTTTRGIRHGGVISDQPDIALVICRKGPVGIERR